MANSLYTNNFRGRAGRTEQAPHLVREFDAIEDAFTALQALNIATYLTTYTNTTILSGTVTIRPDNGFLQELTITEDVAIQMASPLNESQYRVSLLIHGGNYKVTNLWGAQTWKEYGQGNWFELYTGEGPYASMLLDFFWDICSNTWICVASSKNQFNTLPGGIEQRFYPLLCNLTNVEGDDTLGFSRASNGQTIDFNQAYHYLPDNIPRFHGARYVENWCPTASELDSVGWVATDVTVTTDAGAGPASEDVQRLAFDVTGGKLSCFVLPSFGRASTKADPIKVAVSFKGRAVSGTASVRLVNAFMGKTGLTPPVHDAVQIELSSTWDSYGAVLDILKTGNANSSLALDREYPKTLMEISFMSPSGSIGADIQITDVEIQILRGTDAEVVSVVEDTTIGASMVLTASGTGTWVDGTKTLTLAIVGQYMDFSANLEIGKTYLVNPRLQSGDAADIRMQNEVAVWAAGTPADDTYLQDAPFTFQYDGGVLKFVLIGGGSSVYLLDIYEVSGNRGVYCYDNPYTQAVDYSLDQAAVSIPVSSGILDGVAREIASENEIPFAFFRTFSAWDTVGLSGVDANDCRNPVFQSEYGIDGWPARATILQGASKVADGFIQRSFTIPQSVGTQDFTMWIRRSMDVEGNQIVTPQHNDVTTPISRYVDFEAELTGGASSIGGGRVRLDLQESSMVQVGTGDYTLEVYVWDDWFHIVLSLDNDGLHNGFRVRVYPASANVADPATVDVTQQGWVIIDWAQFEDSGGTFLGSSPIVGGETRAIEAFTSALADGHYYMSDEHIATLTSNNIVWDNDDGIYKNVLYSTQLHLADPNVRNMHEFGLVDDQSVPSLALTLATTTLYPIEAVEGGLMSIDLDSGTLQPMPEDEMDVSGTFLSGELLQILITGGPWEDELDVAGTFQSAVLNQILISGGPWEDELDVSGTFLSGVLESKLVTALAPDEGAEMSVDLSPGDCSMTPV